MLKKKKKKLKLGSKVPFESKKTQQHSLTITWIFFLVISILFSNSKVIVNENVNAKQNEYRSSMGRFWGSGDWGMYV